MILAVPCCRYLLFALPYIANLFFCGCLRYMPHVQHVAKHSLLHIHATLEGTRLLTVELPAVLKPFAVYGNCTLIGDLPFKNSFQLKQVAVSSSNWQATSLIRLNPNLSGLLLIHR